MRRAGSFVLAGLSVLLLPAVASAQPRLVPPSPADLQAMSQLLDRGLVSLIESDARGWLKQVTIATRVAAPPETVFRVIADVERYPEFLHNFSRIDVVSRQPQAIGYEWDWRGVLFDFHGANSMVLYPPRRVDVNTVGGDLGRSRFLVDLRPGPTPGTTVVATTLYSDPRQANWVARQLIAANPSMLHAMNLSVGIVFTMGIKRRAETPAGRGEVAPPGRGGGQPSSFASLDTARLEPLLRRGELALVETNTRGGTRQATVFARVEATADRLREVVEDPARYPAFISAVESCDVVSREGGVTTYDMELDFPIFDLESRMEMSRDAAGVVRVAAREGALSGGRWTWEFPALAGSSVAVYGGYNDMRRSGWLMRRLVALEPYFDHALNVSSKLVMLRAVKRRAEAGTATGRR
jgi:ribosome-associated toxin RatA of RatAB toxin-antitoxin module